MHLYTSSTLVALLFLAACNQQPETEQETPIVNDTVDSGTDDPSTAGFRSEHLTVHVVDKGYQCLVPGWSDALTVDIDSTAVGRIASFLYLIEVEGGDGDWNDCGTLADPEKLHLFLVDGETEDGFENWVELDTRLTFFDEGRRVCEPGHKVQTILAEVAIDVQPGAAIRIPLTLYTQGAKSDGSEVLTLTLLAANMEDAGLGFESTGLPAAGPSLPFGPPQCFPE